ncbi:C39 family peptidase [Vibrio sp. ABG19]|uniref:C39 family peptidase n=1 Tax=Vibrio sp. ABG19 TaxID=2817385 RepID=UPI00249F05AD|nr:C39 family peptidase [Vibrio sp. ABG19]WGY46160.1 C39 family peptidase [Vibrio sp. ABG19]
MKVWHYSLWAALALSASAHSLDFLPNRGLYSVPVKSYKEMLFGDVYRQQYDFSCGSAAVASLLTYHYETPVSEQDIFKVMFDNGDRAVIEQKGFSLFDMKKYLESKGFRADGFNISLEKIRDVGVPGITLVNFDGYQHFVVVKGISNNSIIVGDPSRGTLKMDFERFKQYYQGVVLLIRNYAEVGRESFITSDDFSVHTPSPLATGVRRESLGIFSITLPEAGEY